MVEKKTIKFCSSRIPFWNVFVDFQILLRQHDVLLKRQFCDIKDTINSMSKSRRYKLRLVSTSNSSLQSNESSDFGLDNYSVRSASSVTALDGTDDEDDGLFRPRTSSMKTTRDLAALARRRGSKELIWFFGGKILMVKHNEQQIGDRKKLWFPRICVLGLVLYLCFGNEVGLCRRIK